MEVRHPAKNRLRKRWLALALLVAGFGVLNSQLQPFDGGNNYFIYAVTGAMMMQPLLFATWAAVGPPPAIKRVPLTVGAFLVAVLCGAITHDGWLSPDYVVLATILFSVTALLSAIASRLTGMRVSAVDPSAEDGTNRFSVRYLLLATALSSLLLVAFRLLAADSQFTRADAWSRIGWRIAVGAAVYLIALSPAAAVVFMLLSKRIRLRFHVGFVAYTALAYWVIIEITSTAFATARSNYVVVLAMAMLGGIMASLAASATLRVAGYRLCGRQSKAPI